MPQTLLDEVNKYVSTKSPLRFSTLFEAMQGYNELEKDISKQFKGALARGLKVYRNHIITEILFNYGNGGIHTYILTDNEPGYFSFMALGNMERISEEDLSPKEREIYEEHQRKSAQTRPSCTKKEEVRFVYHDDPGDKP